MPAPLYTKTRIAPTPSGYLHLGNVLSFAVTSAIAQKHGTKILLRIDDIDQARANQQYVQDIFDSLNFLEIPWDEGPRDANDFDANYSQLNRMGNYIAALDVLTEKGLVFACTCSRKQIGYCDCADNHIPLNTPDASWRLLTNDKEITVNYHNNQIIKAALPPGIKNFIIRKKNGFPAYQLTSVVDDLLFGVDLVVRGDDLFSSTLAQYQVAAALGRADDFGRITFYHHPLIMNNSGQKLSKSGGATSVNYLRRKGHSAEDIYRAIAVILGLETKVSSWQQLGDSVVSKH